MRTAQYPVEPRRLSHTKVEEFDLSLSISRSCIHVSNFRSIRYHPLLARLTLAMGFPRRCVCSGNIDYSKVCLCGCFNTMVLNLSFVCAPGLLIRYIEATFSTFILTSLVFRHASMNTLFLDIPLLTTFRPDHIHSWPS